MRFSILIPILLLFVSACAVSEKIPVKRSEAYEEAKAAFAPSQKDTQDILARLSEKFSGKPVSFEDYLKLHLEVRQKFQKLIQEDFKNLLKKQASLKALKKLELKSSPGKNEWVLENKLKGEKFTLSLMQMDIAPAMPLLSWPENVGHWESDFLPLNLKVRFFWSSPEQDGLLAFTKSLRKRIRQVETYYADDILLENLRYLYREKLAESIKAKKYSGIIPILETVVSLKDTQSGEHFKDLLEELLPFLKAEQVTYDESILILTLVRATRDLKIKECQLILRDYITFLLEKKDQTVLPLFLKAFFETKDETSAAFIFPLAKKEPLLSDIVENACKLGNPEINNYFEPLLLAKSFEKDDLDRVCELLAFLGTPKSITRLRAIAKSGKEEGIYALGVCPGQEKFLLDMFKENLKLNRRDLIEPLIRAIPDQGLSVAKELLELAEHENDKRVLEDIFASLDWLRAKVGKKKVDIILLESTDRKINGEIGLYDVLNKFNGKNKMEVVKTYKKWCLDNQGSK